MTTQLPLDASDHLSGKGFSVPVGLATVVLICRRQDALGDRLFAAENGTLTPRPARIGTNPASDAATR